MRFRRHGGGRRGRRPAVLPLASVSLEGALSSWPRAGGIVCPAFRRDAVVERAPVGLCPSIARSNPRPCAPPLGKQRTALDRADRTDQASDGVDAPRHVGFLRERTLPRRSIGLSWPPGHRPLIRAVEGGAVDMEPQAKSLGRLEADHRRPKPLAWGSCGKITFARAPARGGRALWARPPLLPAAEVADFRSATANADRVWRRRWNGRPAERIRPIRRRDWTVR